MKTYQFMWRMIRYRPWLYLTDGVLWTLIHMFPLVPGLIAREFFNTLEGKAQLGLGVWGVIVLVVMAAIAQIVLVLSGALADIPHRFSMSGLLRHNMLERVLERPGAQAVPVSAGEAISYFRDDAEQAEDAISWTLDTIGTALFAIVAVVLLLQIDAVITLLVFGPLVGVLAAAHIASVRVEQYRQASRKATGRVTGVIGEMFGAVQAVQVAGAGGSLDAGGNLHRRRFRAVCLLPEFCNRLYPVLWPLSSALQADRRIVPADDRSASGRAAQAAGGAQPAAPERPAA